MEIRTLRQGEGVRCAYCHAPLEAFPKVCPGCWTRLHADCAASLRACPTLGCGRPVAAASKWQVPWMLVFVAFWVVVLGSFLVVGLFPQKDRAYRGPDWRWIPEDTIGGRLDAAPTPAPPVAALEVTPVERENSVYASWARCGLGSFVETETDTVVWSSMLHWKTRLTTTLADVTSDTVVLVTSGTSTIDGRVTEVPTETHEIDAKRTLGAVWTLGADELVVAGTTRACQWLVTKSSGDRSVTTTRTWLNDDVPGGVCRRDSFTIGPTDYDVNTTVVRFEKK